jgi:hypothetical protein
MPSLDLVIVCKNKNCREVFRLQHSNLEEKSADLPPSSRDIEHVAFWCWICGLVFDYTAQDCRWEESRMPDQGQHRVGKAAFRRVFQCGLENCEAPVVVHTITDDDPSVDELQVRALRMSGKATCQRGHLVSMPPKKDDSPFYQIDVEGICRLS